MRNSSSIHAWIPAASMTAAGLAGCGGGLGGADILEDLARQGLLLPDGDEPAFSSLSPSPGAADPLSRNAISIEDLLEAADRNNARIGAARAAVGAAAGDLWQASLYPNPSVELEAEEIPLSGGADESTSTIGVVQPIVVSDRLSAAVAGGSAEQRARSFDLQQTRRAVFGEIRRQVAEILYLREAISLNRELMEVARETLRIAETRFDARAAPESEVIRARVEADGLELAVARLRRDLAAAGERLGALLGGRTVPTERLAMSLASNGPALDLQRLYSLLHESHPRLRAAEERIKAAEHGLDRARAGSRPDIAARIAYGYDGAADEHIAEAGLVIPLTVFDRNQGHILRARYDIVASKERAKGALNDLRAELADAYQRYMSAREQLAAFESRIVAPALRSLAQTREGYRAGKLGFLDLLDAQRTLARAQVGRLDRARELNVARADLHGILGDSLDPESTGDQVP